MSVAELRSAQAPQQDVPSADELKKGAQIEVINGNQTNVVKSQ